MKTTLKAARQNLVLNQSELAQKIGVSTAMYSQIENGIVQPDLEDSVILEKELNTQIEWRETLSPAQRQDIINNMITLLEHRPVDMVLGFIQRMVKQGEKLDAAKIIGFYTKKINQQSEDNNLYPPEFYRTK